MIQKLKKLIMVSRPISWPNTAFPFAAGYLVAGGEINALFFVGTFFFIWPYNLFMYGINDVFDYESDILNPRKGGIEGMREERSFHPTIVWATVITNVPLVIFLMSQGSLRANIVLAIILFFVLAYSAAKLRFKEIPALDSVSSSIHFVGPLVYALALTEFSPKALPYVIAFFLWGMASHAFGAVQDIVPDRKGGIHSIATAFGAKATVRTSMILYALASLILCAQGGISIVVGLAGASYVINIFKYRNISDKQSFKTNAAWKRFIYLNYFTGFVVTLVLIKSFLV